ncbi:sensor histidine kinase [Agromyces salentinus]|uniref:histidine kinase n=1 Tax=Agromyces salentinus TaxID=269421 RepID=A0ABP4YS00_9MICO|nr:histidine kinase [Agromyces salentinus]
MTSPVRSLWDSPPAVPPPPRRVWRDWALIGVLAPLALFEAALRIDVPWRWLWAVVLVALLPTLLWRRIRPFTMLAIAFTTGTVLGLALGGDPQLFTTGYFLVLVYAVTRWGSGRAMLGGVALVIAGTLLPLAVETPTLGDVIGGIAVVITTFTLGLAFRWRAGARARELERLRLVEREQFARDLHDTVAHHVSAIAIQAQAGSAVIEANPDAAADVLRTIEVEASRTLDEMRAMVRVLRRDEDPASLSPAPGLADLGRLATSGDPASAGDRRPTVAIDAAGDLESVPPAVAAAAYRIAQEAVTNARRHATGATRIDVRLRVDASGVRLEVRDDGTPAASARPGYGVRGMVERATLVGGTCEAGPAAGAGWTVTAVLPRTGWTRGGAA